MARSYGVRTRMAGAFEATYGSPPASGYRLLPFISSTLGSEQGLSPAEELGQGRDPRDPIRDVVTADGDAVVPVDLRGFGWWLKLLLGSPTTTGSDPYTHVYTSGAEELPSAAIELQHPQVPAFLMVAGIRANTLQLEFVRSGAARATFGLIAQGEDRSATTQAGTPAAVAFTRFNQFQGSIQKDGSPLGNVTAARISFSNGLERVETIRDDGKIEGADPTLAELTGSLDVRFADTSLLAAAENGTPVDLELAYTISASAKVAFGLHRVFLPKPRVPIQGPGGIQASFDLRAALDESEGAMLTVELINDVEDYD